LKILLDEWLARRSDALRTNYLFTDHGRRITVSRVDTAVEKVARRAGLGRVSPRKLRHTLATQAINRGMSLEAIAALLGHRSLSMTSSTPASPKWVQVNVSNSRRRCSIAHVASARLATWHRRGGEGILPWTWYRHRTLVSDKG
jgi:integrase